MSIATVEQPADYPSIMFRIRLDAETDALTPTVDFPLHHRDGARVCVLNLMNGAEAGGGWLVAESTHISVLVGITDEDR